MRVDSGISEGSDISIYYDPMISKVTLSLRSGTGRDDVAMRETELSSRLSPAAGHLRGHAGGGPLQDGGRPG